MKFIDTHCHPNLTKVKNKEDIINNFFNNGGDKMITIGTDYDSSKELINLSKSYNGIYCSIGIHPCDVKYDYESLEERVGSIEKIDTKINLLSDLEELYLSNKENVVGIGESGLDYYWMYKDIDKTNYSEEEKVKLIGLHKKLQEYYFIAHIELANKYGLPLIIHNRESKDDIFRILQETGFKKFIFHCYSEDLDYACKLIKLSPDCKISFSGIVTFNNAKDIQVTAKNISANNILTETDAPYLTPTPLRGKEENEPLYTKYVIEFINDLRGEDISEIIYNNSINIFGLDK